MKGLCFLFFAISTLQSADLYLQNVRPIVQEIFSQHVEYKEISPLIVKRAMKLYMYRFDPGQIYLTTEEVRPFLSREEKDWEAITARVREGNYADFRLLHEKIQFAIKRAHSWRREWKETFKTTPLVTLRLGTPVSIPRTEQELWENNRIQITEWFIEHFAQKENLTPSPAEQEKALTFFEKIKMRREEPYLASTEKEFAELVLKAIVGSLDAHSAYYTEEEAYDIRAGLKKQFCGVGIGIGEEVDGYFVTEVVPGGPAATSGLVQVGDQILAIDEKNIDTLSLRSVTKLLQGEEGSVLSLKIKEKGNIHLSREKILVEDGRIKMEAIPFGNGNIGYILIDSFYDNREGVTVEKDLREAILRLSSAAPLHGLVLDMRNNLGGFLDQAIKVAGLFIQQGVVVIAKYAGDEIQYSRDYDPYAIFQGPVVVLTSKTSASAAEIVAQTLQDYGAAIVVGDERTYGKGSMQMQTITDESAAYFYKVTVGKYYTISGRSTQIEGVRAQIHVPTQYAPYNIGEKFLPFPLAADTLQNKGKLKQFFALYQQKKNSPWNRMVPVLLKNSQMRIAQSTDYQTFLKMIRERPELYTLEGKYKDLAKREAIQIVEDMALIQ